MNNQKTDSSLSLSASFPELNPNPVVEIGLDGTVYYSNPAAKKLFPDLEQLKLNHKFCIGLQQELQALVSNGKVSLFRRVEIGGLWYEQSLVYLKNKPSVRIYAYETTKNILIEERLKKLEEKYRDLMNDSADALVLANANIMLQEEITKREKAEAILRENQEYYQKIITTITDYIYTVQVEKNRALTTVHSPSCLRVTGYTAEDFKDDPYLWLNMVHKDDQALVSQWTNYLLKGGKVEPLEHRIKRKDGRIRWVRNTPVLHYNDSNELVSYDGVVQDITDTKLIEEERVRADALNAIIENSPDILVVIDLSARIIQFNKAFTERLGFQQEAFGTPFSYFIVESDRQKIAKSIEKCIKEGMAYGIEVQSFSKDRGEVFVLANLSLLKDAEGMPAGIIIAITDISERKKLEELKDEWINIISHELRAPLSAIKEGISLVMEGLLGSTTSQQHDVLVLVKSNIERLIHFINTTLDYQKLNYSRIGFNMVKANINNVAMEAKKIMDILAQEKGLSFLTELDANIPEMKFDYDRIMQALVNLLSNAIKFTDKGSITIKTSRLDNSVCVCVKDTGAGISREDMPSLFNIFSQVSADKKKYHGSGLGLVISKKIIEGHGGIIWVESELNKGTAVFFTIPT